MIPKILHQTCATATLPDVLVANVKRLREINPGWEYRFYDDRAVLAFIERHYPPQVVAAYNSINPAYGATRADLLRYLVLYLWGGVYLDIKSSVTRPLDEVLQPQDSYLLAHWPNRAKEHYPGWGRHAELRSFPRGEFQQWHVIAAPGHPYLRAVIGSVLGNIARYDAARHGVGKRGALRVTGPIAYSLAIASQLRHGSHRLLDTHEELGLVYSVVDGQGLQAHKKLFARHYSTLTEPVVLRPDAAARLNLGNPFPPRKVDDIEAMDNEKLSAKVSKNAHDNNQVQRSG